MKTLFERMKLNTDDAGVEEQVAVVADIPHARRILPAAVALFGQRTYQSNQFPTTTCRIDAAFGIRVELRIRTVGCVQFVQLWATRVRMPRIRVNFSDLDRCREVHAEAAA